MKRASVALLGLLLLLSAAVGGRVPFDPTVPNGQVGVGTVDPAADADARLEPGSTCNREAFQPTGESVIAEAGHHGRLATSCIDDRYIRTVSASQCQGLEGDFDGFPVEPGADDDLVAIGCRVDRLLY